MHPAHWRLEDLIGLPKAIELLDDKGAGTGHYRTEYSRPGWIHKILSDPRPALVVVDEFNRARDLDVYQALVPFLLEGKLGPHELRPQDFIVALANPNCSDYEVTELGDAALMSRFAHFTLEPEKGEWSVWNRKKGNVHLACIETFEQNPGLCPKSSVPSEARVKIYPDRRNVTRYGMVLHSAEKGDFLNRESITLMGHGILGVDATSQIMTQFDKIVERGKCLTVESVLSGEVFKMLQDLKEAEKIVVLNNALSSGLASDEIKPKAKQLKNIERWLHTINIEHLYAFVQSLKAGYTERAGNDATKGNQLAYTLLKGMAERYNESGKVAADGVTVLDKVLRHKEQAAATATPVAPAPAAPKA